MEDGERRFAARPAPAGYERELRLAGLAQYATALTGKPPALTPAPGRPGDARRASSPLPP